MKKTLIVIGGGELKTKDTLLIDEYIALKTKNKVGERRANALFIPTASHDSMPYFNSFRKTYTSVFDIKVDVALMCYGEMSIEKIQDKIKLADMIYVGGGDTIFMLSKWQENGIIKMLLDAYNNGTIIAGLSAGAICWFKKMFTDSAVKNNDKKYHIENGLGIIDAIISPHYNYRKEEFLNELSFNNFDTAYALEDNSALEFIDGEYVKFISSGGKAYKIVKNNLEQKIYEL